MPPHNDIIDVACRRFDACRQTLSRKSDEYASDEDSLHNFRRAGDVLGCSPARALVGMMAKHFVSILDIVDLVDRGSAVVNEEQLDEKITDAICYLVLLEALLKDEALDDEDGELIGE